MSSPAATPAYDAADMTAVLAIAVVTFLVLLAAYGLIRWITLGPDSADQASDDAGVSS